MLSEASAAPCDQTRALNRSIPEVGASLAPSLALNAAHGESRPLRQATGPGEMEALGLSQLSCVTRSSALTSEQNADAIPEISGIVPILSARPIYAPPVPQ